MLSLKEVIELFVADELKKNEESAAAIAEFFKNIPGRILQLEIETGKAVRNGIKKDESVYKYGVVPNENLAFLEFFEHRDQGSPTMSIYADKKKPEVLIRGAKIEQQFLLKFFLESGIVKKQSSLTK